MTQIEIGSMVKTKYNSGVYIGEVIDERRNFFLVKVLAVETHPDQGDLHNPGQVAGVAFHERKALAYTEKMNARKRDTILYEGDIPTYEASLRKALADKKAALQAEGNAFGELSLEKIADLERDFYDKILS